MKTKPCEICQKNFKPKRSTARFCSGSCRVANHALKLLNKGQRRRGLRPVTSESAL